MSVTELIGELRDDRVNGLLNSGDIRPEGLDHASELITRAQVHGIGVEFSNDWRQWTSNMTRIGDGFMAESVVIPAPRSDYAYGTILHEFGHLATVPRIVPIFGPFKVDEIAAAKWARDAARYWTDNMRLSVLLGLSSYVRPKPVFRGEIRPDVYQRFVSWLDTQENRPGARTLTAIDDLSYIYPRK